ncbi:MAG TPA: 50S ribosomal protein L10 [Candidatus Egerieicola pullicola]|uniref:Large ribosomal subunit protein uL10 n=1 Tax=Candidatus Egerieicola pullicola TaxID=2840775 RepID=A0A9D1AJE4_9FIRM|nr:50S ribosomal protein L10 [Candidatus Egerieicola pullicola]
MPSATILSEKQKYVADLAEQLKSAVAGVIVDYRGINVADDTALRKELREAGVKYTVVKNTMLRLAAREAGLDIESVLEGTTALATSENDYVAAAKILCKYADAHENFNIKLGFMDGEVLDTAKVQELGNLPSKEELLTQLVYVLSAPMRGLAVSLNEIAKKQGEGAGETEEATA